MLLEHHRTALVLIDVQEKLVAVMHNPDALLQGLHKMVAGAIALDIPIIWNEQNPDRMGPTVKSLRERLVALQPIPKMHFGCCASPAFMRAVNATGRDQMLLAGIETHVCVCQTAQQLLQQNYGVQIVTDAVASRKPMDQEIALQRITYAATTRNAPLPPLTTAETALFEMMQTAEHPRFKDILNIIR